VANTTTAATSTPSGSVLSVNTSRNESVREATPRAATSPMSIANPPACGIGTVCTLRSFGGATQPRATDSAATSGVAMNVTPAATRPMTTWAASEGCTRRTDQ